MKNVLMTNGTYGAKIGNLQIFTRHGAIEAYKKFCKVCLVNTTMEKSIVLTDVSADMRGIGFTAQEIEDIEIEVIKAM